MALLAAAHVLVGCGLVNGPTTGSSTLTIVVVNLMDAEGSRLHGELVKNVEPTRIAPTWAVLRRAVDASPYTASTTLTRMPEGEFSLTVVAEPAGGTASAKEQKGFGCELTFQMGAQRQVTVTINGLDPYGDRGYGTCDASFDRLSIAP